MTFFLPERIVFVARSESGRVRNAAEAAFRMRPGFRPMVRSPNQDTAKLCAFRLRMIFETPDASATHLVVSLAFAPAEAEFESRRGCERKMRRHEVRSRGNAVSKYKAAGRRIASSGFMINIFMNS